MEDYIPLQDIQKHIRKEKINNVVKLISFKIGEFIGSIGNFAMSSAKSISNGIKSSASKIKSTKPKEESYLKVVAENFAHGSFSDKVGINYNIGRESHFKKGDEK